MSPGLAFGWHVWTRHRLGLTLCAGYWLLVVIGANVLPLASFPRALPPSLFAVPCVGAFSYLVCIFSFSRETPLETRASGFPTRLLTLPLPTRSLVAWPMLWGTSILASAWLTLTWSVLRIAGDDLGILIWWPALLLAVVLAWLQAIVWSPFPLPWLRAILAAPLVGAPVIVPHILLIAFNIGEGLAAALLAVQLPAAYLIAVRGVSRARRGDMACWTWPGWRAWLRWISATTVNRPFLSPARAQLWFEWRRCGLTFPLMTAVWAIFWVPMIPITVQFIEDAAQGGLALVPPILLHEIGSHWLVVGSLLFFLPLLAAATGLELGKLPGRDRTRVLSSFLATRPVSEGFLVRAKFEAAALSALAGWGVAVAGLLLWFALGGRGADMAEQFEAIRQRHATVSFWTTLTLLVGGSVVLTWLQMIEMIWVGLVGRTWQVVSGVVGFGILVGLIVFGEWLAKSPQYWQTFTGLLPWLAGVVVVLKSQTAAWSLSRLKRDARIPSRVLIGVLAAWGTLAIGLLVVLRWLMPGDVVPFAGLVIGITLLLPLSRLALAPLALAWNRHR